MARSASSSVSALGIEHVPGNIQGQAVELPLPDDVGHRLPRQAAAHQVVHPTLQFAGDVQGHVPVQLLPALVGGVAHQLPGLQLGLLHSGLFQPGAGIQKQIVVGGGHRFTFVRFDVCMSGQFPGAPRNTVKSKTLSLRASSQTGAAIRFLLLFFTDSHDSDIDHCLGMTFSA